MFLSVSDVMQRKIGLNLLRENQGVIRKTSFALRGITVLLCGEVSPELNLKWYCLY